MWVLKFSVDTDNSVLGSLATKHNVSVQLYPLSSSRKEQDLLVNASGLVTGEEKDIKRFLKAFSSLPQVIKSEDHNSHFTCLYKEKDGYEDFYNPEILFLEPWIIDRKTKKHSLVLGSWRKEHLRMIMETLQKEHKGDLLKLVQQKSPNIFFFNVRPAMTEKQSEALKLAVKHGYYEYPRKIDVKQLAHMANASFSTFQAHLRKAEKKIVPYVYK